MACSTDKRDVRQHWLALDVESGLSPAPRTVLLPHPALVLYAWMCTVRLGAELQVVVRLLQGLISSALNPFCDL